MNAIDSMFRLVSVLSRKRRSPTLINRNTFTTDRTSRSRTIANSVTSSPTFDFLRKKFFNGWIRANVRQLLIYLRDGEKATAFLLLQPESLIDLP